MSKHQLYWIFQIIVWSLYGAIQLFLYSVEFQISFSFFLGQLLQVAFMVGLTHLFTNHIIRNNWIDVNRSKQLLEQKIKWSKGDSNS